MFKSITDVFKGHHQIEKAFLLAEEAFAMYPKKMVKQMPSNMANEWRQNFRKTALDMQLSDHEAAAMMVIPFIGLIENEQHKEAIARTMSSWNHSGVIRLEVYFHYIDERDKTT